MKSTRSLLLITLMMYLLNELFAHAELSEPTNNHYVSQGTLTDKNQTETVWKSENHMSMFGVLSGMYIYQLNLRFSAEMAGLTSTEYIPVPDKKTGFTAGLTYERLLSRRSDRMAIKINLLFSSQSYYCYSERSGNGGSIIHDDTRFSFKAIKVPLLFQYSLTGRKIVPYINAGAAYQLFMNTDYEHSAEVEDINHEINTYLDKNMRIKAGEISGVGGLGARTRIYKNVNLHILLLVEAGNGVFVNELRSQLNGTANKPYKQHSVQETLLLGLTF